MIFKNQCLSSKDIATVEVINNPGVEYDADTHAVIKINLKHKQEGGLGVRTSVFDSQGRKNSDSEQIQLTYDTQRINAFLSFNNSSSRYQTDQSNIEKTTVNDVVWKLESEMPKWNSNYYNQTINGGLSTELFRGQTVGASITYSQETDRWGGASTNKMLRKVDLFEDLYSDIHSHARYHQWMGNLFYDGKLSEKWHILLNADFVNRETNDSRLNQEFGSKTSLHEAKNENETSHHIYAGNVKVNYQVAKNLALSAGADASYMDEKKDYSAFENEVRQTSSNLHAEETKIIVMRFPMRNWWIRPHRHLYPYFSLSYPVGNVEMGLSMTTKVKRPSYYELRNSEEYFNRYSVEAGNPWLLPQYTTDISYSLQCIGHKTKRIK